MKYNRLGKTNIKISELGFGASAIGGMFGKAEKQEGLKTVHSAFDRGINYFDTSPAYGTDKSDFGPATSELFLGEGLKNLKRDELIISTKAGKTSSFPPMFNFSYQSIIESAESSLKRLRTDYIDILFLHDIEYGGGENLEIALTEGLAALEDLKKQGKVRFIGVSCYPIEVLSNVISNLDLDVVLVHNHYTLINDLLSGLIPKIKTRDIGLINASPFASGLLTSKGPPDWYPTTSDDLTIISKAINFCKDHEIPIEKLALQFSMGNSEIPTTLFSCTERKILHQNIDWNEGLRNQAMIDQLHQLLEPLRNKVFDFGAYND